MAATISLKTMRDKRKIRDAGNEIKHKHTGTHKHKQTHTHYVMRDSPRAPN